MAWAKGTRILLLCAAMCLLDAACGHRSIAQNGQTQAVPRNHFVQNPQPQSSPTKTANPQAKNGTHKAGVPPYRMGDWLRAHQNLTPDQQEKLLENDPNFKRQNPQRQAELKDWLRKFNSRPPAERELMLNRMQWLARLTPQQRQDIRDANKTIQTLPPDRRVMVHKALRHLSRMSPQERQQEMESDRFKSTFSEQEQGVLTKLATINPPEPNANGGGGQPPTETPK